VFESLNGQEDGWSFVRVIELPESVWCIFLGDAGTYVPMRGLFFIGTRIHVCQSLTQFSLPDGLCLWFMVYNGYSRLVCLSMLGGSKCRAVCSPQACASLALKRAPESGFDCVSGVGEMW
jgi:hypothetical protein